MVGTNHQKPITQPEDQNKDLYSNAGEAISIVSKSGIGFIDFKAFAKDLTKRPTVVPFIMCANKVNSEMIFSKASRNIMYMANYDEFVIIPFLH